MKKDPSFQRQLPSGCRVKSDASFDWQAHLASLAAAAAHPGLKRYYKQSVPDPATPVNQSSMLALDLETTGMDWDRDAIVSIGWVPFDYHRIQCGGARQFMVMPDQPLCGRSIAIHGITHSELAGASDFSEPLDRLLAAMTGRLVVVHYHAMERQFLAATVRRRFNEVFEFPVIDTMQIEHTVCREKNKWWRPQWFRRRPSLSMRLADVRERYGLPRYTPHHALTDALATAELLLAQLRHHYDPDTPISRLWL